MTQPEGTNASGHTVFDKVAGKAKEVVGTVIGDETLVEEGELQQRKAATAKTAAELAAEAEQREAQAEVTAEQAANRVEQQRVAAELAERTRVQQLERERTEAEAAIEREAAQREVALERQHAVEERVLDARETEVVVDLADDAREAAAIELEAKRANAAADALESAQRNLEQR